MHKVYEFETLDSTNTYLKENWDKLQDEDVVTALHQTSGRGRLGRTWNDSSSSLLFSLLLKDSLDPEKIGLIPLLTGVSVLLAFQDHGIPAKIKWPNDVLVHDRKACGILVEAVTEEKVKAVVDGVGINLNNSSFDPSIKDKAISLSQVLGKPLDRKEMLASFLLHFDSLYQDFQKENNSFLPILKENSYLDGKEATLDYYGENKHVRVLSVLDDGRLLVDDSGKKLALSAGEVSLHSVYTE